MKRLSSAAVINGIRISANFSWPTEFPPQEVLVFMHFVIIPSAAGRESRMLRDLTVGRGRRAQF
jgi:hypothetical protein